MRKVIRIVKSLLLAISLVACSHSGVNQFIKSQMYPGPELPKDQIAVIKGGHSGLFMFLLIGDSDTTSYATIHMIDGQLVKIKDSHPITGEKLYDVNEVQVLPGPHEVVTRINVDSGSSVGWYGSSFTHTRLLVFNFKTKAGHTYTVEPPKIKFIMRMKNIVINIVDEDTKEVVASKVVDYFAVIH